MSRQVHIVGAGLAGLSAAIYLAGEGARVTVHEAAPQAGGRCRSYHDATLGMEIDNGNHLILSANHATLDYLRAIGGFDLVTGPERAEFPFVDLATGERWTIAINAGRFPWWIFDAHARVPGTRFSDYVGLARLAFARSGTIGDSITGKGRVYDRLLRPLLLAALNTEPLQSSAALAAAVLRDTVMQGGDACRPLIAREGLSAALIEPALRLLAARRATVRFGSRLRSLAYEGDRVAALDFGDERISLDDGHAVVLAVPPVVASAIVPDLTSPNDFRAIVNAHFRIAPPAGLAPMTGVINATTEWVFAFPGRLSVTVSGADRLLDEPREALARTIWTEVARVADLKADLPPWQIVRERRATFAATVSENSKRPAASTRWRNLVLAGDWTDTGLPATIESAVRSGRTAAALLIA